MKHRGPRSKRYGLTNAGLKLSIVLCIIVTAFTVGVIEPGNERIVDPRTMPVILFGILVVPVGLYIFDAWLSRRQKARDFARAMETIRKPLRNTALGGGRPLDFDPHFVSVWPGGTVVAAVDPRRRVIRWISTDMIDAEGRDVDDGGVIEGMVADVSLAVLPRRLKWYGWLPARAELSVSMIMDDETRQAGRFTFNVDDKAAQDWRKTFERWMHEDRDRLSPTPKPLPR